MVICDWCHGTGSDSFRIGVRYNLVCPFCLGSGFDRFKLEVEKIKKEAAAKESPANRSQVGGDHYRNMKIQPVEFITANSIAYLEGNVIKYICRHRSKGGAEDLKKAKHYIDLLLQHEYPDERAE